jgi:Predicted transcriptional regulator with C-terminal CBS domains
MTQKELANLVGVSTSTINLIESGGSAPSYNTAKRIFEVLASKESETSAHNAGELCSQKIVKLKPTNTLGEAMTKMDKEKISQIPIFDGNNAVGVITDSGIIGHMSDGVSKEDQNCKYIIGIMHLPIVENETPASTLAPLIKYSKCILVRKGTKIIGIITGADVLKIVE